MIAYRGSGRGYKRNYIVYFSTGFAPDGKIRRSLCEIEYLSFKALTNITLKPGEHIELKYDIGVVNDAPPPTLDQILKVKKKKGKTRACPICDFSF